ncbi:MAG TPA: hypothetical protein VII60_04415 [Acidimicrobiales bacterium]|jgi:hypothetical protein
MTTKRFVIGLGVVLMLFGLWTLLQAHTQVGVCTVSGPAGAGATSGLDSTCVKTLMAYLEGFVFVACGLIITVIAFTMIARQEKIDLRAELRAVPRSFKKGNYEIHTEDLDDDVEGVVTRLLVPGAS